MRARGGGPVFPGSKLPYRQWELPVTEQAFGEILTLPLHCGLTDQDVDTVIHRIFRFYGLQT
jgi:dTDP-4-amino-4,6-dideoxygalactose transaminase